MTNVFFHLFVYGRILKRNTFPVGNDLFPFTVNIFYGYAVQIVQHQNIRLITRCNRTDFF